MASKAFFSSSIFFHLEFTRKIKTSLKSAWTILGHDHTLNIFRHQWRIQGGLGGRGGSEPPPPPSYLTLIWSCNSSSTESYITDFFNETRHNPRYLKMKLFWGTLFWVPPSAREAVLTAPTATGLHILVFFNRNNSTALKNSYMFSAISLAFLSSLICVDCIRNTSAIIFVHEK